MDTGDVSIAMTILTLIDSKKILTLIDSSRSPHNVSIFLIIVTLRRGRGRRGRGKGGLYLQCEFFIACDSTILILQIRARTVNLSFSIDLTNILNFICYLLLCSTLSH